MDLSSFYCNSSHARVGNSGGASRKFTTFFMRSPPIILPLALLPCWWSYGRWLLLLRGRKGWVSLGLSGKWRFSGYRSARDWSRRPLSPYAHKNADTSHPGGCGPRHSRPRKCWICKTGCTPSRQTRPFKTVIQTGKSSQWARKFYGRAKMALMPLQWQPTGTFVWQVPEKV